MLTPRTELEGVPLDISEIDLLETAHSVQHTRLLVYDKSLDDIVGVLHLRDLYKALGHSSGRLNLKTLLRTRPHRAGG